MGPPIESADGTARIGHPQAVGLTESLAYFGGVVAAERS